MKVLEYTCCERCSLNDFLRKVLPSSLGESVDSVSFSNSKVRRLIVSGSVFVDGRQCRIPSYFLQNGSSVRVNFDEKKFSFEKKANDIDFILEDKDVLFEDENLIVVNKPAFFPTEKTMVASRANMHDCVVDYLWKKNPSLRNPPYAGIMHRLDHETSGALLFTKSRSVNAAIHDMFVKHTIQKTYRALARANSLWQKNPKGDIFKVEGLMARVSPKSSPCKMGLVNASFSDAQDSLTEIRILCRKSGLFYLECLPHTGRTHQIRLHCASVGLPLVGDTLYGGSEGFADLGGRIMLHSRSLEFLHPLSGEKICVYAPLPPHFEAE